DLGPIQPVEPRLVPAQPPRDDEKERQRDAHAQEEERYRRHRKGDVDELDEDRSEREHQRADDGEGDAPPAVRRAAQRRLLPPRTDPSTPRRICRPSSEPIERAALFASASTMPCDCRPPRGPVLPKRMSETGFELCAGDRKSTRLNSSHSQISYAVFCLKKKKKNNTYKPAITIPH